MNSFVWTVIILYGIEVVGTFAMLGMGHVPQRTKGTMAANAFVCFCLFVYGIWALTAK